MNNLEKNYKIKSGDKNGYHCLYELKKYNVAYGKIEFYWHHIQNLSIDKSAAIDKARKIIGISDYDFNINYELTDHFTNNQAAEHKINRANENAHVNTYHEHNEFIPVEVCPDTPIPSFLDDANPEFSRQSFSGKILFEKWEVNSYEQSVHKMYFLDNRGFVLFGTLPAKVRKFIESNDINYKDIKLSFIAEICHNGWNLDRWEVQHENCIQFLKCHSIKKPTQITMGDNNV